MSNRTTTSGTIDRPDAHARTAVLRIRSVSKRFGAVQAIGDVSLEVAPGEIHALLGENGAGKSTLMNVAAGSIVPDEGTIEVDGAPLELGSPLASQDAGLAIVRQHPALMPDLTVAENMAVALPDRLGGGGRSARERMRTYLDRAGSVADLDERVEHLNVAQRQLVELAKGLALEPKVLVLDEPTAPLGRDAAERLLELVRQIAAQGTAIIYISHRLPEVRAIADRATVMRDGRVRGAGPMAELSDDRILELIVGRSIDTTFPDKRPADATGDPVLEIEGLGGDAFSDVALRIAPGEIVGLAGIAGNGQTEVLRALAGLERAQGVVRLNGETLRLGSERRSRAAGIAYLPSDRHNEGLMLNLSVRENASLSSLGRYARGGIMRSGLEREAVAAQRDALSIRTASLETPVSSLSGGNQQKVVLARAMLSEPRLILAEEPTQGVDAGARIEIYRILREAAARGIPVLVVSSDSLELEGLCDRIVVFSRGHAVSELAGDDVTEERMARAIVTATAVRREDDEPPRSRVLTALRRFAGTDYGPAAILIAVILVLGIYTYSENALVLSTFNVTSMLTLLSVLVFISYGQLLVVMTGGIDLSVGPLAGLLAVVASFFFVDGKGPGGVLLGLALMAAIAVIVGLANGGLVRFGGFTPIAATLATYIALQGVAQLLRPEQGGYISADVVSVIQAKIGGIPVAFLLAVVVAIVMERGLRRARWGLRLRAAGSREDAAHAVGVPVRRTVVLAYVGASLMTFLAAILLIAQLGIGDASQGTSYTLTAITAVVLGGASLFGGRGSFIGVLLGAFLIQQITNATTFLGLSQAWQYWAVGLLALTAAGLYTQVQRRRRIA
ncbi:MAG: ATP-binding cassette domain-containing protein [Patulibacter sp.]